MDRLTGVVGLTHLVLSLCSALANISSQPSPGKVERVNNGETSCSRCSPACQVRSKELPKLVGGDRVRACSHENCLELVVEGKVDFCPVNLPGTGWKVACFPGWKKRSFD